MFPIFCWFLPFRASACDVTPPEKIRSSVDIAKKGRPIGTPFRKLWLSQGDLAAEDLTHVLDEIDFNSTGDMIVTTIGPFFDFHKRKAAVEF